MAEAIVNNPFSGPTKMKILIFGGGFSGQRIGALAKSLGFEVLCSRRSIFKEGADFVFNSATGELPSSQILDGTTHLLSCIPPDENGQDPVIANLKERFQAMSIEWAGYLSTTGVYGDSKGAWVNESTKPNPTQQRSKRRLDCENEWLNSGLPAQILRLPGIYGPGRSALENILNGKCRLIEKPEQIFSRIHVDDIAGATMHLISLAKQKICPNIINVSDDLPSTNIEVICYAAKLIGYQLPPIEPFEIASKDMSPMALSFWQENRRISNKLLCEDLNYSLIHKNYKSGLEQCVLKIKNKL